MLCFMMQIVADPIILLQGHKMSNHITQLVSQHEKRHVINNDIVFYQNSLLIFSYISAHAILCIDSDLYNIPEFEVAKRRKISLIRFFNPSVVCRIWIKEYLRVIVGYNFLIAAGIASVVS